MYTQTVHLYIPLPGVEGGAPEEVQDVPVGAATDGRVQAPQRLLWLVTLIQLLSLVP